MSLTTPAAASVSPARRCWCAPPRQHHPPSQLHPLLRPLLPLPMELARRRCKFKVVSNGGASYPRRWVMKAVRLHGYGGVDQLVYEEVPIPIAGPGEGLVKLSSASVNPIDYKIRRGDMKDIMPLQLPAILGYDLAGQVVALGEGVTEVEVNAFVMAVTDHTYAEYVT